MLRRRRRIAGFRPAAVPLDAALSWTARGAAARAGRASTVPVATGGFSGTVAADRSGNTVRHAHRLRAAS